MPVESEGKDGWHLESNYASKDDTNGKPDWNDGKHD